MFRVIRTIWLGLALIALAAALLLASDLDRRQQAAKPPMPQLAVLQWASTPLLDNTVAGILEGLRQQGFEAGRTAAIQQFNAGGDNATGNALARDLTGGRYTMVLTASTLALQAVAQANRTQRVLHVFGGVTDPYGAGVGISGARPDQHPAYLVGVGTFQPVERAFRLARQMNPRLRRVGVVWNPGESNSEACLAKARAICRELGIELVEAQAGNSSEVPEAVRSVLARDVQAIWIGGDTVAIAALAGIVSATRAAGLPVFTNDPSDTAHGALFGVGASYRQVGIAVGEMGGRILKGADPRDFGVENLVPEVLAISDTLAAAWSPAWSVPDGLRAAARVQVGAAPVTPAGSANADAAGPAPTPATDAPRSPAPGGRVCRVGVLAFGASAVFDTALVGLRAALAEAGWVEGRNLELQSLHANGDMGLLPQVARRLAGSDVDAIVPMSTPCLQAIVAASRRAPVVFGVVSAPLEAGAGRTFVDHLPDVTGAVWTDPEPLLFSRFRVLCPGVRSLGVLYNPSEANSRRMLELLRPLVATHGWRLVERAITTTSEIPAAMQSLLAAPVDAVLGMGDNTVADGFAGVVLACRKARVPLLASDNSLMGTGALFSCGASPLLEGRRTGRLLARVLGGEAPAGMAFEPSQEVETTVDLAAAAALRLRVPVEILAACDVFHHPSAARGRPLRIGLVNLVRNPVLDAAENGLVRGLHAAGFREGVDYTLRRYDAQGEIAQLPAMVQAALTDDPDLIVTLTTPALIAAIHAGRNVPVVFAVASDPAALGLFTAASRPAWVTGVHDDPPVDRLLDMARRHDPGLSAVGTVYDPAQPNAVLSVEKLRQACRQRGVTLYEATAATVSELPAAVQVLIQRRAGALVLSADNLVCTGFPALQGPAAKAGIPIYATDTDLVRQGASGAVGDDFAAWGAQAARLAARVLVGVPPAALPIEKTRVQAVLEADAAATPPDRSGGAPATAGPPLGAAAPARPWQVRVIQYNEAQFAAESVRGILAGLAQQGLEQDRNLSLRVLNAQGDMTTLTSIMTAVRAQSPDLVMTVSTPTLQAALRQLGSQRIVFSTVGDAVVAGAGQSETVHLPHVTGITTRSPFEKMARLIRRMMPGVRAVGTLYCPAEINSEVYRTWWAEALQREGLKLVAVPLSTSAEISEAAAALVQADIQLVAQLSDNLSRPGFSQIARRASEAGMPFFCFDSSALREGATLALARDYYHTGVEAAAVAVRVLGGASPATIPFANTQTEILAVDPERMARYGLVLPPDMAPSAPPAEAAAR